MREKGIVNPDTTENGLDYIRRINEFARKSLEFSGLTVEDIDTYFDKIIRLEKRIVEESQIKPADDPITKAKKVHCWFLTLNPLRGEVNVNDSALFDYYKLDRVIDADLEHKREPIGKCGILTAEYIIVSNHLGCRTIPLTVNFSSGDSHTLSGVQVEKGYILVDNVLPQGFRVKYKKDHMKHIRRITLDDLLACVLDAKSMQVNASGDVKTSLEILKEALELSPSSHRFYNLGNRYLDFYEITNDKNPERFIQLAFNSYRRSRDLRIADNLPIIEGTAELIEALSSSYPFVR